jgi:hypothetical protein
MFRIDGGTMLLATMFGMHPFLKKLFAHGAYQGSEFHQALATVLPRLDIVIVADSDDCGRGLNEPAPREVGRGG